MEFPLQVHREKLCFPGGDNNVGAGLTVYLYSNDQGGSAGGNFNASETDYRVIYLVTRPGTLRNLVVRADGVPGVGQTFVYTVRVNGANSALTVTVSTPSVGGSDLVNAVQVVVGDRVTVQLVTSAAASARYHSASICFEITLKRQVYDHVMYCSGGNIPANSTEWLAFTYKKGVSGGHNVSEALPSGVFLVVRKGTLKNLVVHASAAPGVGQTFVYTVRVNGANTALTITLSGAVQVTGTNTINVVQVDPGQRVTLLVVTSLGAAATAHIVALDFEEGDYRTGGW